MYERGLREALPLSLQIDSVNQQVGKSPTFTLIGAPPGATVYWSSFHDGVATPEFNTAYNQTVEANGTARLVGGQWTATDEGPWIKEVLVQTPEGANHRAMVQFRVFPAAVAPTTPSTPAAGAGNFITEPLFSLGDFEVTGGMAALALAGFWLLTKKK